MILFEIIVLTNIFLKTKRCKLRRKIRIVWRSDNIKCWTSCCVEVIACSKMITAFDWVNERIIIANFFISILRIKDVQFKQTCNLGRIIFMNLYEFCPKSKSGMNILKAVYFFHDFLNFRLIRKLNFNFILKNKGVGILKK